MSCLTRYAIRYVPSLTRRHSSTSPRFSKLPQLVAGSVDEFRQECFSPGKPMILAGRYSEQLSVPAAHKWFIHRDGLSRLDSKYLNSRCATTSIPVEITQCQDEDKDSFHRVNVSFADFITWTRMAEERQPGTGNANSPRSRLYVAQASVADLPSSLRVDLPTPGLVLEAGRGDLYNANFWLGLAPTFTPLHRDPNPNILLQIAGTKIVRMFAPEAGDRLFAQVKLLCQDGQSSSSIRGAEMMQGKERTLLEGAVWDDGPLSKVTSPGFEAVLSAHQALFIPKGWWHSVRGVGQGITASVNWWFR